MRILSEEYVNTSKAKFTPVSLHFLVLFVLAWTTNAGFLTASADGDRQTVIIEAEPRSNIDGFSFLSVRTFFDSAARAAQSDLIKVAVFIVSMLATAYFVRLMAEESPVPADELRTQRFGDQMAMEGEVEATVVLQAALYSFVIAYGALASMITGCCLITIPVYYLVGMVAFYGWHFAAHWTTGDMNSVHMQHHHLDFPGHDFYGDQSKAVERLNPNPTGSPTTLLHLMDPRFSMTLTVAHEGPLVLAMVAIVAVGGGLLGTSIPTLAFVIAGYSAMALIGSALHISFHLRNFHLEPYKWYRELRSLHYIHHLDRKNFAMVNMDVDKVAGSYMPELPGHHTVQSHLCIAMLK